MSPHPIDIHVGLRIRQRRSLLGMTQTALGATFGRSHSLIQKYESGFPSVPASDLFRLAAALDVPPSFFFEGARLQTKDPTCTRETIELVRAYFAIHNPSVRESIAETIRAIAAAPLSHRHGS